MTLNWLTNTLKATPFTRALYCVLRDGKFKVTDSIKLRKLTGQFRGHDLLVIKARNSGYFSNFFQAVGFLHIARKNKQQVAIQFDQGPYLDPERPEKSWWSYFFETSKSSNWQEAMEQASEQSVHIIDSRETLDVVSRMASRFERYAGHQLVSEFVLKKEIADAVMAFKEIHFAGNFVIGLHYRGTDKVKDGLEANRVDYRAIDETIDAISSLDIPFRLFVATDEESLIHHLDGRANFEPLYTNSQRSHSGKPVHFSESRQSNYQLGFDALLDALLLSECDFLLRTESNLSKASEFFNPTLKSINLTREFAYSTPESTKEVKPNVSLIRRKVASAYRHRKARPTGKGSGPDPI